MDTIFAPATAVVKSGVAIIRVSGAKSSLILKDFTKIDKPEPGKVYYTKISKPDDGELIDIGLAIYFKAPHSFTGEDVVEFHVHGGIAVINNLLTSLSGQDSMRFAEAGEFSKRAFVNGKMDLTAAEGLSDLIDAETSLQAKQALRQMQGELGNQYESWRHQLIGIMALLEAFIDFPDEEIPEQVITDARNQVESLKLTIAEHLEDNRGERLRQGLYITIIGEPNAGKSSLLNLLAKRDVAIVSEIAGTTRDVIEVHLDIAGYPVIIADTAGLRKKAGIIEDEGIKRAYAKAKASDFTIAMFDATKLPKLSDDTLKLMGNNTIVVVNKIDVAKSKIPETIADNQVVAISVSKKQNVESLLEELRTKISENYLPSNNAAITRLRHRNLLEQTLSHLAKVDFASDLELLVEDLRLAARELGKITGRIDVEDILDVIFSSFCIGK